LIKTVTYHVYELFESRVHFRLQATTGWRWMGSFLCDGCW